MEILVPAFIPQSIIGTQLTTLSSIKRQRITVWMTKPMNIIFFSATLLQTPVQSQAIQ